MSTTSKNDKNTTESSNSISEADDMRMFQAARRTGRRNAMGDLSEQLAQSKLYFHRNYSHQYIFYSEWFKFLFRC